MGTRTFRRRTAHRGGQSDPDKECLQFCNVCKSLSCKCIKTCKRYSGVTKGVRVDRNSTSSKPACHEGTSNFPEWQAPAATMQLETDHAGSMDPGECPGPQAGVDGNSPTGGSPRGAPPLQGAGKLHGRRAFKANTKRGNHCSSPSLSSRQFRLQNVSSSKKGQLLQADNRFIVRLLSAVFYDYCYRVDKSTKFCVRILQDLLNNNRGGANSKKQHSKS